MPVAGAVQDRTVSLPLTAASTPAEGGGGFSLRAVAGSDQGPLPAWFLALTVYS